MIALGIAYALTVSVLVAVAARWLEQLALARRWPTRGIWVAALGLMTALGIGGVWMASLPASTSPAVPQIVLTGQNAPAHSIDSAAPPRRASTWYDAVSASLRRAGARADEAVGAAVSRLAPYDGVLLVTWAVLSALLAGIVARATIDMRRLRRAFEHRHVDGVPILLSDDVGPAVVGARASAIVLPRWILELDGGLRALVLRHEQEHLAARDPLVLLAAIGALVLTPWNAALWWSWRRLGLAIEIDCDRRVLDRHIDVRRYAELLLLVAQRTTQSRRMRLPAPMLALAVPLQPRLTHLSRRVSAMTQSSSARSHVRTTLLASGVVIAAALACALPQPHDTTTTPAAARAARAAQAARTAAGERALVHVTSVGLTGGSGDTLGVRVLVYAPGPARIGIGTDSLVPLTDTLRLHTLPAMTLDVTDSDVHIVRLGGGRVEVGATITGGPSTSVTGSGAHVIFMRGGYGIQVGDRDVSAQR